MVTALSLNDALQDRMSELARARGTSPQALLDEAVRSFVEREEVRQDFLSEAEESWREYQDTGLHLTGDELRSWLRTWGTPEEKPAPSCHA